MLQIGHDRFINYGILSPKIENSRQLKINKNRNNFENYTIYSKFTKEVLGSPINLYSHKKKTTNNTNNLFSPKNSSIIRALSPIYRNNNSLHKSLSQRNIKSRPLSNNSRGFPSLTNHSSIKSTKNTHKRNKKKKIVYTNINKKMKNKQNYFKFETEKLFQENHQIKKIVKILSNQLSELKQENIEKDREISIKEKQINDIILKNNLTTFENTKNNTNEYDNSIISDTYNNNGLNNEISILYNDSIYANALPSDRNSSTSNLFFKIKKEIRQTNNEIKLEKEKYEKLKKSIFLTKVNELKIESELLEDQVNKISSLLSNALSVKQKNEKKSEELKNLKENITKQEKIFDNLISITSSLEIEENELKNNLAKNKNDFKYIIKEVNKNNNKLKKLKKKNENLKKEKIIQNEKYTINLNGNPVSINNIYINKIDDLKKSIRFYKKQIKYTEFEINKLNDKRKKLIEIEKLKAIRYGGSFENQNDNNSITNNKINIPINLTKKENLPKNKEEEFIVKLKKTLEQSKEDEMQLEEKIKIYQNKLKEIDINNEVENNNENQSQIEFGIDSDNPYYIEDEENIPEKNNKFTSSQFNQFTYILFKNFESKGIVLEESKKRLVNYFIEFANKNNLSKVQYPSNNFYLIVDEFTKIILNALNCNNSYNYCLTKIFISALFYNSECEINKFIEYFNVLFSYTRNYTLDETKYITKLKSKYKEPTKKLITCINDYVQNKLNSSQYFPLLKMKELLDKNKIVLKDKYIEFLFYYMKKFNDPEAKLEDLKYTLLDYIISSNLDESTNINKNIKIKENIEEEIILENHDNDENKIDINEKEESNILDEFEKMKNKKYINDKSPTHEDYSNIEKVKNHTEKIEKDNSDDYEGDEDEDSMTEITNEEYIKQLKEAINIMQEGLKVANTNFNDLMTNVVQKRKITGNFYECITIEDFNEQLKSINIIMTDLKLSCLCSKYSIPNELRLIDKNKIGKDIEDNSRGKLRFEEEDKEGD